MSGANGASEPQEPAHAAENDSRQTDANPTDSPGDGVNGVSDLPDLRGNRHWSGQTVTLTRFSYIQWAEPNWLWQWVDPDTGKRHDAIPAGTLGYATGIGGVGKSSFALWLAARLSKGELPGMYEGTPQHSVIVAPEDGAEMTALRLAAVDADHDRVILPEIWQDGFPETLHFPEHFEIRSVETSCGDPG
ncbi:hypothetical protein ACG83_17120 [Frankia sp. R43]|nr:hypothetical protein ACG83_17120 [Frankia sp. R43]